MRDVRTKHWFFEKTDKLLVSITKKKRRFKLLESETKEKKLLPILEKKKELLKNNIIIYQQINDVFIFWNGQITKKTHTTESRENLNKSIRSEMTESVNKKLTTKKA